ncbi:MAG: DUF354 domain-containing protein [Bacteroidales bacterium]|jgi:predicted glycosyltransferase|nr:DUF354 domain-containing protein [Bacteroidales bacterium]
MKILIDIGHPAHVHLYRNFYMEMAGRGHEILVTVKDIPIAKKLLNLYDMPFIETGRRGGSIIGKGIKQLKFDTQMLAMAYGEKIDIGLGTSITNCHASMLSPMKSIIFDDDDDSRQPLMTHFGHPFANCLLSPDMLKGNRKKKDTVFYAGYHELAYLHPKRFTPDISVLQEAGLEHGETFFIMRFNAFEAHHDVGERGVSLDNKICLAEYLSGFGRVFITTEKDIEPELRQYQLKIPPHKIHSLMSYAKLFVGDSGTMTSEAAVLGVPAFCCISMAGRIATFEEQEHKYELMYSFKPNRFENMMAKIKEIVNNPDTAKEWSMKRDKMLADKIDVTAFMVWFVENYPESKRTMLNNLDYQFRFR